MRLNQGRDYMARVIGKPDASGFSGAVGTGDFAPACYLGLSADGTAPNAADTELDGEISAGSLAPALATFAHTTGSQVYTLSKTFTSDQEIELQSYSVKTGVAGLTVFKDLLDDPASLFDGDQAAVTISVDLG